MIFPMFEKRRVYLDYAAATPLSKTALTAMKPFLTDCYGNPSAIHKEGAAARQAVEATRETIAKTLQIRPEYVTFTSGGTEANNLAIIGTVRNLELAGRDLKTMEIITTKIEHPSVLEAMCALESMGVRIRYAAVNSVGQIDIETLRTLLTPETVLCSVAYANSEIGTVQKVRAIKKILEAAEKKFNTVIQFHIDAAQAPLWLNCQPEPLQADLVSLDVGKCNGPKGIGMLVRSRRAKLTSTLYGGGQESGLRPGTENVAGIVGASVALAEAQGNYKERAAQVTKVRDEAIAHIQKEIPIAVLNGATGDDRLANNINLSLPGLDTEFATVVLDAAGFAVSTKSACAGAGSGESTVVKEISGDGARASSTLRLSLSPATTIADIRALTGVLKRHIESMSGL